MVTDKSGNEESPEVKTEEEPKTQPEPKVYNEEYLKQFEVQIRGEEARKHEEFRKAMGQKDKVIEGKNKQLQELRARTNQSEPTKRTSMLLEEIERMQRQSGDETISPRIAQLRSELAREEQVVYQQNIINQEREKIESQIREANLDPEDSKFIEVWDAFDEATSNGLFQKAYRRLNKTLRDVPSASDVPPKNEKIEDIVSKLVEEKLRKEYEKRGWLDTSVNEPSASSQGSKKLRDAYIEDPNDSVTRQRYLEDRRKRGI